jgi:hypothetical protein
MNSFYYKLRGKKELFIYCEAFVFKLMEKRGRKEKIE